MSWLSELFNPSKPPPPPVYQPPPDNSAQVMQMQLDYLEKLRQDQAAKDAELAAKDPTATRQAALSSVNARYTPGFETSYLPDVYDDPLATTVYGEQRGKDLMSRVQGYVHNFKASGRHCSTQNGPS